MSEEEAQPAEPNGEFAREPVPPKARLGFRSFLGQYAGEHTAGTELMIGPLFVTTGVGAAELILGLLAGNLLAALSWTFMTAPIATRARLTLYCQLERVCGRKLTVLYNLANGVMFCFLAGAMVTVSATALGVWFGFDMPGLRDRYPNSLGWAAATLGLGALIAFVAATGYEMVARFASWAAPWMVAVFLAFGFVATAGFGRETGASAGSLGELWALADAHVWKGGEPMAGQTKFTFWHVTFFAWFANMAMHIGMSDLSVLRFARKSWYGIASAAGMYLGHFMAWISASLLYALQLHRDPSNTDVLPGPMAAQACGVAGLLCVVVAGWTTANPTIYRAGLAFQAVVPRASRAKVTFATGMVAAVAGMFPLVAMKLLDFVALYGLALMPMGAVIFCDFWLAEKLGLKPNWAAVSGKSINWAAAAAWGLTIALCLWLVQTGRLGLFFASLPGWFLASALYLGGSLALQRAPGTAYPAKGGAA